SLRPAADAVRCRDELHSPRGVAAAVSGRRLSGVRAVVVVGEGERRPGTEEADPDGRLPRAEVAEDGADRVDVLPADQQGGGQDGRLVVGPPGGPAVAEVLGEGQQ